MLLVKTRTGRSPIHGTGLFAAEPIAKGTAVWRFTPTFDLDLPPILRRIAMASTAPRATSQLAKRLPRIMAWSKARGRALR